MQHYLSPTSNYITPQQLLTWPVKWSEWPEVVAKPSPNKNTQYLNLTLYIGPMLLLFRCQHNIIVVSINITSSPPLSSSSSHRHHHHHHRSRDAEKKIHSQIFFFQEMQLKQQFFYVQLHHLLLLVWHQLDHDDDHQQLELPHPHKTKMMVMGNVSYIITSMFYIRERKQENIISIHFISFTFSWIRSCYTATASCLQSDERCEKDLLVAFFLKRSHFK